MNRLRRGGGCRAGGAPVIPGPPPTMPGARGWRPGSRAGAGRASQA